jgi:membrane protein YqaA with SNARE-associated domain
MKDFFVGLLHFIFRIGYFGPLVTGILDSSFLSVPFGNDLVVVGLVARNHAGAPWYVLMAACGSTIGAMLNALVARKLGEEGIKRVAGEKRYESLRSRIGNRAGPAVVIAGLTPPPFPFNAVIAAVAAIGYPIWRILIINFFARAVRFAILAVLAIRFGHEVLSVARSEPFEWAVTIFIGLCIAASVFSIWNWWRKTRRQKSNAVSAKSAE